MQEYNINSIVEETVSIKTATHQIVEYIKGALFTGKLSPGTRIKENDLCKWLGVSRTPIREALRVLEMEELVEVDPNKGIWVRRISKEDIDEVCEFRCILESYCIKKFVGLATENDIQELEKLIDKMKESTHQKDYASYYENSIDFHSFFVKKCENKKILNSFLVVRNIIRCGQVFIQNDPNFYKSSNRKHKEILEAIRQKDSDRCEKLLIEHLIENSERMKRALDSNIGVIKECNFTRKKD